MKHTLSNRSTLFHRLLTSVVGQFFLVLVMFLGASTVQAAPTFQAAGSAIGSAGGVTPLWPAHIAGDVALLVIETKGAENPVLTTPAGFAQVLNSPQAASNKTQTTVYWVRATSSAMASPVIADAGDHVYAQILTYRGVINSGDPWNVTAGSANSSANTTLVISTPLTTTVPDTLIVQIASRDLDSTAAVFSAQANASLTGIAERSDGGTDFAKGGGFAVWDGVKATAGSVGTKIGRAHV